VFEMTDYAEYAPMKKATIDFNNMNDKKRKNDHMFSDILGSTHDRSMPIKADHSASTSDLKQ
jgi:hypothetical protein